MPAVFALSLCLTTACQNLTWELIYLSRALIFATATQRTPINQLTLVLSRAYACEPMRLYTLHAFKAIASESGFQSLAPIGLNLGSGYDPSLWDTHRSWHTLNYWEPLQMKLPAWTTPKV